MVTVTFNDQEQDIRSIEQFGVALDKFARIKEFELWLASPQGQSICMLRNGPNALLMYLRHKDGDSGFTSRGDAQSSGLAPYTLGNGQVDEYPLSWCINVEQCYKALAYFFVNNGSKPEWVSWQEA